MTMIRAFALFKSPYETVENLLINLANDAGSHIMW